jgi:hypothetical protein
MGPFISSDRGISLMVVLCSRNFVTLLKKALRKTHANAMIRM